uniref:Uncharacterized protein n=1 Tax=Anguilla anguilla TaxID=7936 RepID=A0A0E9TWP2_ANGAN
MQTHTYTHTPRHTSKLPICYIYSIPHLPALLTL